MAANYNSIKREAQSSSLDLENQGTRSPEELFAEILKSPGEYTTEIAEDLSHQKKRILSMLETHRPLKIGDYQYGLSQTLLQDRRLLVFEWEDKRIIREYTGKKYGIGIWECRECDVQHKIKLRPTSSFLYVIEGIVFVPRVHDCKPRDSNLIMQYQNYLEEGDIYMAKRLENTVSFEFGQYSDGNTLNVVDFPSFSLKNDTNLVVEPSASLKRKVHDSGCNSASLEPADKKPKTLSDANALGSASYHKSELTDVKIEALPVQAKTFPFNVPSKSVLKEVCAKLGIKYGKEAKDFWEEIKFVRIDPFSKNIQSQKFNSKNLYKIFSNCLTGTCSDYEQIYYSINSAFRDKLVSDGKMPVEEINTITSSYTVTKKHLKFIAGFLPCRIMVFNRDNNDEVKKYGEWKCFDNNNTLTIVLSCSNGKYSVVSHL